MPGPERPFRAEGGSDTPEPPTDVESRQSGDSGPLVLVSAAEHSADVHAAAVIRAARRLRPETRFAGVAGPAMAAAGCRVLFDMTAHAAMLAGAFGAVGPGLRMLRTVSRALQSERFAAAMVVDSPVLNLPVAKRAKSNGVPVLYFIAPQTWAWGRYRTRRVRARVDRMAVILPFEEEFFRGHGINATFVGHPLLEALSDRIPEELKAGEIRSAGRPVLALLPGSRRHVVQELLPGQLEVARLLRLRFPGIHIGVSVANDRVASLVEAHARRAYAPVRLYRDQNAELLTAADLALVASGTATLEVAFRRTPMIVMYNASRLGYQLVGRWLIQTRHLSLPNILAGREIVPELMPHFGDPGEIAELATSLLRDPAARERMASDLGTVVEPLTQAGAAERTARILLELADRTASGVKAGTGTPSSAATAASDPA